MQTVKVTLTDGHSFETPAGNIPSVKRMLAGKIKDFKLLKEENKPVKTPTIEKEADQIQVKRGRPKQVTN